MDREKFWALIQETRASSGGLARAQLLAGIRKLPPGRISIGGPEKFPSFDALIERLMDGSEACCQHAARLAARLRELPPAEIAAFDHIRDDLLAESYRWDLWGAGYLINGGCSDDGFDSFRGWLFGQGAVTFQDALRDPDALADHPEVQGISGRVGYKRVDCESLLAAPLWAYEAATGREPPNHPRRSPTQGAVGARSRRRRPETMLFPVGRHRGALPGDPRRRATHLARRHGAV
jgi:uncharacterized protein DUF4240